MDLLLGIRQQKMFILFEESIKDEKKVIAKLIFIMGAVLFGTLATSKMIYMNQSDPEIESVFQEVCFFLTFVLCIVFGTAVKYVEIHIIDKGVYLVHILLTGLIIVNILITQEMRMFTVEQQKINWQFIYFISLILQGFSQKNFKLTLMMQFICLIPLNIIYQLQNYFTDIQLISNNFAVTVGIIIIYFTEKYHKIKFLEAQKNIQKNQNFQNLYDEYLLIPIIQIKIQYNQDENQSQLNYFNLNNSFKHAFNLESRQIQSDTLKEKIFSKFKVNNTDSTSQTLQEIVIQYGNSEETQIQTILCTFCQSIHYSLTIQNIVWQEQRRIIMTLTEITLQFNYEKMKQLDQYKDSLMASVSHELKTPINSLLAYLQTGIKKTNENSIRQLLEQSLQTTNMLLFLISDILDYSQMAHQQLRVNPSQFSLLQAVRDVLQIFEFSAGKQNIQLGLESSINKDLIMNDQNRFKQVISNLISNAIKFTDKGSVIVIVSEDVDEPDVVSVSVQDTGYGIEQGTIDQLFTMFGTFDNENQMNVQGVGLGLTICKSLVGIIGPQEKIDISTKLKEGSKFSFKIFTRLGRPEKINSETDHRPTYLQRGSTITSDIFKKETLLLQPNPDQIDEESIYFIEESRDSVRIQVIPNFHNKSVSLIEESKKTTRLNIESCDGNYQNEEEDQKLINNIRELLLDFSQQKLQLLIVDDNPFNIDAIQTLLEEFQQFFNIQTALSGEAAIDLYKNESYQSDIIFMDIDMPQKNGIQTSNEILQFSEQNKQIKTPWICLASAYDSIKNTALDNQQWYYLSQPIDLTKIYLLFQTYFNIQV